MREGGIFPHSACRSGHLSGVKHDSALRAVSLRDDVSLFGRKNVGCTHGVILPPLRGSNVNIVFSVGYVCVAHFTHGWVPAIATRFMWVAPTVGILPQLRGSNVNIVFTVGYVCIAYSTHVWGPYAAMRLSVALRAESLCDD
jgi:hypothetical protein